MPEEWSELFNIPEKERKKRYSYEEPYDYQSIMHYPMHSSVARDPTLPIMLPVNCDYDCPTHFGSKLGLSKSDVAKVARMYQCPTSQRRVWADQETYCQDHFVYKGKPLDCKSKQVSCEKDVPCCKCGSGTLMQVYEKCENRS